MVFILNQFYPCIPLLQFLLLFGLSIETSMQYNIKMKYEDTHMKKMYLQTRRYRKNRQVVKSGIP